MDKQKIRTSKKGIGNFRGFRVFDFGPYNEIENSENSEILCRVNLFYLRKFGISRVKSSDQKCSVQKSVLKKFYKFNRKTSVLGNTRKTPGLRNATLLKRRLQHRCFPVKFKKFLRTPFLKNTSGQLLL